MHRTILIIENIKPINNLKIISQIEGQFIPNKVFIQKALIRWIKKSIQEINLDMVVRMLENLKSKIVKAKNDGLESLL